MKTLVISDTAAQAASLAHVKRFSGALTCGLRGARERFPVATLADAAEKYCAARDAAECGAGLMPEAVVYCDGKPCARISYNGRVWELGGRNDGGEVRLGDRPTAAETDWSQYRAGAAALT